MKLEDHIKSNMSKLEKVEVIEYYKEIDDVLSWKILQKRTDFKQYANSINELCASSMLYNKELFNRN